MMSPLVRGDGLFKGLSFSPVIQLTRGQYIVRDFTKGPDVQPLSDLGVAHDIGRYNEHRPSMYTATQAIAVKGFKDDECVRDIHMGVDIGGKAGTPVHAFCDGVIHSFGYNPAKGDYGNVIVTQQVLNGLTIWALYGHLSNKSIIGLASGQAVTSGQVIGWLGEPEENGGWPPHVHLQLSRVEPVSHDMPGVVSRKSHAQALKDFPDPKMVLGHLYDGDAFGID